MVSAWPLACAAIPPAAVGCCTWRWRGDRYLTVVVKAELVVLPDGATMLVAAHPVSVAERPGHGEATLGVPRPEVTVTASAPRLPTRVQLMVGAGAYTPLVKHVDASALSDLAPIVDRDLSLSTDADADEPTIPDDWDWKRLQNATTDQQLDTLRGDEWIALRGLDNDVCFRLPAIAAAVRLDPAPAAMPKGLAFPRLEVLHINADDARATLLWRCQIRVDDDIDDTVLVGGVAPFGRYPAFPEELTELTPTREIDTRGQPHDDTAGERLDAFRETSTIGATELRRIQEALANQTPFAVAKPGDERRLASARFRHTAALEGEIVEARRLLTHSAPFSLANERPAARTEAIPGAPWARDPGPAIERPRPFADTLRRDDDGAIASIRDAVKSAEPPEPIAVATDDHKGEQSDAASREPGGSPPPKSPEERRMDAERRAKEQRQATRRAAEARRGVARDLVQGLYASFKHK